MLSYMRTLNKCIDCGILIDDRAKRCKTCHGKLYSGSNHPQWKDLPAHRYCIDCGKEICKNGKSGKCMCCIQKGRTRSKESSLKKKAAMKKLWLTREHQLKIQNGQACRPTKPELKLQEILNGLFPNEYKYVGDFQVWFGGRNPDFMNINGKKKLVELFGDYWHKGESTIPRIEHFKKYGFDTLVIWESDLKNEEEVKSKLVQFHGRLHA